MFMRRESMSRRSSGAVVGAVLGLAVLEAPERAGAAAPPAAQGSIATAGTYALDESHASVAARILHHATSYTVFRANNVSATLQWDPVRVENSKVEVAVDTRSIDTPVAGFGQLVQGERYLNTAKFPEAKFVSTSIRRTGPKTGVIEGQFTFLGQTKPMTVNAEMVGESRNMRGVATVGFHGVAKFKRSDYGSTHLLAIVGDEVELILDLEFGR
jgi:polyisoprenoid-binding protein YceI